VPPQNRPEMCVEPPALIEPFGAAAFFLIDSRLRSAVISLMVSLTHLPT
jgi:hypothetical protein